MMQSLEWFESACYGLQPSSACNVFLYYSLCIHPPFFFLLILFLPFTLLALWVFFFSFLSLSISSSFKRNLLNIYMYIFFCNTLMSVYLIMKELSLLYAIKNLK